MKTTWLTVLVLCSVLQDALTCLTGCSQQPKAPVIKGSDIAAEAEKHVGSKTWSYEGDHKTGCNTWKCNTFVAEMIEDAGASLPHRHTLTWSPIGANEWADTASSYLTKDPHWILVTDPQRGDIAAYKGHVGVVVGPGETISAGEDEVVRGDWGFRPDQSPTFWRYVP